MTTMQAEATWPNQAALGVPENPECHNWHWLSYDGKDAVPFEWFGGWLTNAGTSFGEPGTYPEDHAKSWCWYHGPCLMRENP